MSEMYLELLFFRQGDTKAQREAAWALSNLTTGGSHEQIAELSRLGALKPMCDLLTAPDATTIEVILDALSNILASAEGNGEKEKIALIIEESGGLDKLDDVQHHENETLYYKAMALIERYFQDDSEDQEVC